MGEMSKMGFFPENDRLTSVEYDVIDGMLEQSDIPPEHREMVSLSILGTMSNLASENKAAEYALSVCPYDGPGSDALDRIRHGQASVADKLRLLQPSIVAASGVGSLELGRCHHFLQYNQEAEQQIAALVDEGIAEMGLTKGLAPTLHKMRVHGVCYSDEERTTISGIVISMKEDIAKGVRHRSKAYLSLLEPEGEIAHYIDDISVSWESLQKQLKDSQLNGGCINPNEPVAGFIRRTIQAHPENMLTSIYYGFCENEVTSPKPLLANAALRRLV